MPKKTYIKALLAMSILMVFILPTLQLRIDGVSSLDEACAVESPVVMHLAQSPMQGQTGQTVAPQSQPVQRGTPAPNGQPQTQSMPAPATTPQASTPSAPIVQQPVHSRGGQVTLNFDDADVYSVIQTVFGDVLRVNYIVDPRVKGRVTFRSVAPVPRESVMPLMEVVLRLNGIGLVEEGGLYRIVPIADISKEPAPISIGRDPNEIPSTGKSLLQVIPIRYVSSTEVIRLLGPFLSTNALVVDVPKGNQVIIVDTDANVKRLLKLVEVFDNEGVKQKKPQIFVYHCQNGKAKDIATTIQQMFLSGKGASGASAPSAPPAPSTTGALPQSPLPPSLSGPGMSPPGGGEQLVSELTRIFPDEVLNAVITLATPEDYELIKSTLVRIDIVPRQVVIEGVIAQVTLTDNLSLGLSYLIKASAGGMDFNIGLNGANLNIDQTKQTGTGFTLIGTDSSGQIRAFVTALATESKAKLLAAPHILVSDNREARIQVGQQVPITTSETYGAAGVTPQRIVQYKDIGIILKVKPRVNEGGLVALEVGQEVSTFSTIPLGNIGETQIIINKTEATTNLVVQDGQTIVIGGLIREDTTKSLSGIPWLSKVPLIGWLFGNTEDDKSRAELIILLTPHVIKNQKEAKAVTSDFVDQMTESSKGRIQKEDLLKKQKQGLQNEKTIQNTPTIPPAAPSAP